jgi:hypothetical protein
MPGAGRRPKLLKAVDTLAAILGTGLVNPAEGDLLLYDATDERFENRKTLTGDYTVVGTLTATAVVADDLTLSNDLVVGGDAGITGLATVGTTLVVTGATTLNDTLEVAGAATLSSTLALAGTLSGAGFSFTSGSITTLTVSGVLTAGTLSPATLAVSGNTTIGGSLQVTGAASFVDDVTMNANLSAGAIAGTSLSTGGNISSAGSLSIAKIGWTASGNDVTAALTSADGTYAHTGIQTDLTVVTLLTMDPNLGTGGGITVGDIDIVGDLNHDGTNIGFYGTTPAAQSAAYTITATAVEDRVLLASASATTLNNNNVLAALLADLQAIGILA